MVSSRAELEKSRPIVQSDLKKQILSPPIQMRKLPVQDLFLVERSPSATAAASQKPNLLAPLAPATFVKLPEFKSPFEKSARGTRPIDCTARMWQLTQEEQATLIHSGHATNVLLAEYTPEGKRVTTASRDGIVRKWDFTQPPSVKQSSKLQRCIKWIAREA